MTDNSKADKIIKTHMVVSMGAGLVPIPFIDMVAVTAVQLDMLRQLANHYNIDFKEQSGKSIISAISGSVLARMGASSVKAIPFIGSILGSVTMSALSGASTFAIGNVFKEHFKAGGDLTNINIEKAKSFFKEKMEEGKQMAKDMEHEVKEKAEEIKEDVKEKAENIKEELVDDIKDKTDTGKDSGSQNSIKSLTDQLKTIAKMKDDGILTEEDFKELKKKIIDKQQAS